MHRHDEIDLQIIADMILGNEDIALFQRLLDYSQPGIRPEDIRRWRALRERYDARN